MKITEVIKMPIYIYASHIYDEIYFTDARLDYDILYCEQCGDSDWEVGVADSYEKAVNIIKEYYMLEQEDNIDEDLDERLQKRFRKGDKK